VFLGSLQTPVVGLLAVNPDELLSKLLWEKFRHLARMTVYFETYISDRSNDKHL